MRMAIVLAAASALSLAAVTSVDAKSRHHRYHGRYWSEPYAWSGPYQVYPNRPAWARHGECYTDEGGGRFMPCDYGGGRR
jgi:hypothetical protein